MVVVVGGEGERNQELKEVESGNTTCLSSWKRRNKNRQKVKLKLRPGK